jgi:hypothetical protein
MKTKRAILLGAALLLAMPFFGVHATSGTANPHKITVKDLTVDTVDTDTKIITAHSGTQLNIQITNPVTNYTISLAKNNIRRGTGEKAKLSEVTMGDSITVRGKTSDGENIAATEVKDKSLRRIRGLLKGVIFDIAPVGLHRPDGGNGGVAIVVNGTTVEIAWTYPYTKFKNGKQKITYADLLEGDTISVQGIMHLSTSFYPYNNVYNTTQVKVRSHGSVPTYPLVPTTLDKKWLKK